MSHYKYLIIGGGMTADAAVSGIRQTDLTGSIGLISAESDPPYNRPPLSKRLWQGQPLKSIWRETESQGVELHLGRKVQAIDPQGKSVTDDQGKGYTFEKLLLATGGTPRRLPFGNTQIIYFRTLVDYQRLRVLAEQKQRFAVIGGGFIGSEIAAALAMNGRKVVMIFPGQGIGERIFPPDLARFLNAYYRKKGIEVLSGELVIDLQEHGEQLVLKTKRGQEIVVDGVVAGLGIEPNTELARQAGLKVENGILVDEFLRTSNPNIYAAGDVANFFNPTLYTRLRVEHEDNANTMGQMAGRSMAGDAVAYHHLPYFYSDMFDLGYEAVGNLNPELETIVDWQDPYRKGVIYYLQEGQVRGVLLWNVWGQVEAARSLISEPSPVRPQDLQERLPA
ncbi:MAG: FAD-dependent oxidoreductase [Anaerolineae bacterium]|nr:FAD-dependent oxidoreductase [Anaerolineae bacterium]